MSAPAFHKASEITPGTALAEPGRYTIVSCSSAGIIALKLKGGGVIRFNLAANTPWQTDLPVIDLVAGSTTAVGAIVSSVV